MTQQPDPAVRPVVFVLFGATGDLARRMVLPAVYRLACEGLLPRQWLLAGCGRGGIAHENFRAHVHDALTQFGPKPEGADWDSFAQRVFFAGGGFSSDNPGAAGHAVLAQRLCQPAEGDRRNGQVVHQLRAAAQRCARLADHVRQAAGAVGAEPAAGEEHALRE